MGPRTIGDRLLRAADASFVGRQAELAVLSKALHAAEPGFVVAFVHGPGGMGKSCLLQALLRQADADTCTVLLDCRQIEPTPEGFLAVLGASLNPPVPRAELSVVVDRLARSAPRVVIALDTYETFGLMDTWLRQEFMPALPDNVFTIISGRESPNPAWLTTPGWQGLFREIELHDLPEDDARQFLASRGLSERQISRVQRFARGYPLALQLASAALGTQPDLDLAEGPPPNVVQQLTTAFLTGLPSTTMEAVEAASTIRRVTEELLRAMLDVPDARASLDQLQALPFVETTSEGVTLHDVVRETIARNLARRDPERYRKYRARAWHVFTRAANPAVARNLWQATADFIYLIENPIVRGAFFPQGLSDYRVEPATKADARSIADIATSTDAAESARWIEAWWSRHPEAFSVARGRDGAVGAFYFAFDPVVVDEKLRLADPVTAAWTRHLNEHPVATGERVLFIRRRLSREAGELPCPSGAACTLDVKRTYMSWRPSLRRVYSVVTGLPTLGPILAPLGFQPLPEANETLSGVLYHTILLDFGPQSIDGWLRRVVGVELGELSDSAAQKVRGRRLVTILFTDIVGSTAKAAELGDRQWSNLIEAHHGHVRRELTRYHGREIDTAGDGFFAMFESPADAILCARAISESVAELGISIRAGIHTGECEVIGEKLGGIAVHIGARVATTAGANELLVSSTVKDLVAGSGIRFEDRGGHILKGIPGEWRLFAVVTAS